MSNYWDNWDLSYVDDEFGPLKGGFSIQEGMYNTIQKFAPAYIAEMNRHLGGQYLNVPKEYRFRPEYSQLSPEENDPRLLVIVDGTTEAPEREQANVRSTWFAELSVYLYSGQDWQECQALALAYIACFRSILVQNQGLGGIAEVTKWVGETYKEIEHNNTRTTGIGVANFNVTISGTVDPVGGIPIIGVPGSTIPSVEQPAPLPDVDTTSVQVFMEEINA